MSRAGIPTLRFDYRGTGDSSGAWDDFGLEDWVADVLEGVAHARDRAGREAVCLIGLRLGTSVAALAARDVAGLAGLVLWDVVKDGAGHLRELATQHAKMLRHEYVTSAPRQGDGYGRELLGHPMGPALKASLQTMDVGEAIAGIACPTLMVHSGSRESGRADPTSRDPRDARRAEVLAAGPRIWLEEPFRALIPAEALSAIVSWTQGLANEQG